MALRTVGLATAALAALAAAGPVLAQSEIAGGAGTTSAKAMPSFTAVTPAMLEGAAGDAKNWIHPNGSYAQTRYYPGNQINTSNVAKLRPAFVFQTGASAHLWLTESQFVGMARPEPGLVCIRVFRLR